MSIGLGMADLQLEIRSTNSKTLSHYASLILPMRSKPGNDRLTGRMALRYLAVKVIIFPMKAGPGTISPH